MDGFHSFFSFVSSNFSVGFLSLQISIAWRMKMRAKVVLGSMIGIFFSFFFWNMFRFWLKFVPFIFFFIYVFSLFALLFCNHEWWIDNAFAFSASTLIPPIVSNSPITFPFKKSILLQFILVSPLKKPSNTLPLFSIPNPKKNTFLHYQS